MKLFFICINVLLLITSTVVDAKEGVSEELSVESFSRLPFVSQLTLSPDGKQIAYVNNLADEKVSIISVYNIKSKQIKPLMKTSNEKFRYRWLKWANNKTLLFSMVFPDSITTGHPHTIQMVESRLMAVETDASNPEPRQLLKSGLFNSNMAQFQDDVIDFLPDDPNHILLALDTDNPGLPSVFKVNIYTEKKQRIQKGNKKIRDWLTDQQGHVRVGLALDYKTGDFKTYIRDIDSDDWRVLFKNNQFKNPIDRVKPLAFGLAPNILYYQKYHKGKLAVFKLNLSNNQHSLVYSDPDYDVNGKLVFSRKTGKAIAVEYDQSKHTVMYWDDTHSELVKQINLALPNAANRTVSFSQDESVFLVFSERPGQPGAYYLVNQNTKKIGLLFKRYPELSSHTLAKHRLVQYTARDGVKIQGYLTLPKQGAKPYPTIIFPHGGPGARDTANFDPFTAFMVSRGYAVFRPNFRGSEGYGFAFSQKQMKRWGLEMQDDLTDATTQLIDKGLTDPNRVCIVGASYGGYAAMMATVKTPDLYQCAVSFAGVSDLNALVSTSKDYFSWRFVKEQMGHDFAEMKQRSPRAYVEKIKTPLLILHGQNDRVVSIEQSRQMVRELKNANKPYQYIELEKGSHHLSIQKNRDQFFKSLEAFLKQYLG